MEKLLLHVCCGPCATHSIETLKKDYDLTCYFYNPCIEPLDEFDMRVNAFKRVCLALGVKFIIENYENDQFRKQVKGLELEPENGKRCLVCYQQRLKKTADYAVKNGFGLFTTTLTISPHKNSKIVFEIANKIATEFKIKFLEIDLKKQDGFKKSVDLSKEFGIYRQDSCGCEFSRR